MEKRLKIYFICSAVMLTLFSVTFLLMPVSNMLEGVRQRIMLCVTGGLFWISFITGYTFLFLAKSVYKRLEREFAQNSAKQNEKWYEKLRFYSNVPTAVADTAFIAALIVMAILNCLGNGAGYAAYVDLFILILSLNVHLLSGGEIYKAVLGEMKRKS